MHEITISYWEHSEFQTFGVNYMSRFHMCSPWPLRSGIYLPPGWVTLHVLFPDRGLKWGCRECNTDPHDLWPRKAAWSSALKTPHSFATALSKENKTFAHSMCLFMPNDLHPFYSHLWLVVNVFRTVVEPDAHSPSQVSSGKREKKSKRQNCFTFRPSVYRPHVSSHLSLVYIHTMTLPLSVGTRCHHLAARRGWLGARWVSPRYL